ncbi:protein KASH5 isoform X2 [Dendropsophus ebraccatus]|uniref:protein KASH5 isoform X2 n=1 Tax=Dendropsophus ebraccatus TaxID=150705 RepID=UPI0038315C55
MMSVEVFDGDTITASDRNHHSESEYWSTDESSEQSVEPPNEDSSQKYFMQTGILSSEEQILDGIFQVCDAEERGMVPAFQIIQYLKSVTDPNRDGKRLQCLSHILDPDGQGTLVDLLTFRKAMSKWIESCWIERDTKSSTEDDVFVKDSQPSLEIQNDEYGGSFNAYVGEHTDLSIKIAELNCTNRKLTDQKAKLQRSLDIAEETNTLLMEEISNLKSKLKSSQQALQHAQSICNELEDTKMFVKRLEDKISVVTAEKKQLEKDTLLLCSQKQSLLEENDKLISENERLKEKLDYLIAENSKLLHQLCEYENLLVQKEELLTQKAIQSEELKGLVEEQKILLQELKNKMNNLQEELLQTHEDIAIHSSLSHKQCRSSLSNEMEEIQEFMTNPKLQLPDPFYNIPDCSARVEKTEEDIWTDTEAELEEKSTFLLKGLSCLTHLKCAWETYVSKLSGGKQINTNNKLSLSKRTRSPDFALLPVNNQLAVYHSWQQQVQDTISARDCRTWLFTEGSCLLAPLLTKLRSCSSPQTLLLAILLYTLVFPIWSGKIWPAVSAILTPHLEVYHLEPPPI